MSTALMGGLRELEEHRAMMGTRAVHLAGENAVLREAITLRTQERDAAIGEVQRLQAETERLSAELENLRPAGEPAAKSRDKTVPKH